MHYHINIETQKSHYNPVVDLTKEDVIEKVLTPFTRREQIIYPNGKVIWTADITGLRVSCTEKSFDELKPAILQEMDQTRRDFDASGICWFDGRPLEFHAVCRGEDVTGALLDLAREASRTEVGQGHTIVISGSSVGQINAASGDITATTQSMPTTQREELRSILQEIADQLRGDGSIKEEEAADALHDLDDIRYEIERSQPRSERIMAALGHIANIASVASLAGKLGQLVATYLPSP